MRPWRIWAWLLCLLLISSGLKAMPEGEDLRIGLVTVGPGQIYWERFGHNAILVEDRNAQKALAFNYGIFDFSEENFLLNFLRGKMRYSVSVGEAREEFEAYAREGRAVDIQWLNLGPARSELLYRFLLWNVRPENRKYVYDYFLSNCSTKVRDALDGALDGRLRRATADRASGTTYRAQALRLSAPEPWAFLGIHAGLGPMADRPISAWEEMFLPQAVQKQMRELRIEDESGLLVPAVSLEERIHLPRATPADSAPPWTWWFLAAGFLAVLCLYSARRIHGRAFWLLASAVWLVAGMVGIALMALWLLTGHEAAWRNQNALLFNPLCLLLLAQGCRGALFDRAPRPFARKTALAITVLACIAACLKILPFAWQDNLDWLAFWLPIHAGLAYFVVKHQA